VTKDSVSRTLSARYYKDGSEILINQGKRKNPRRLTPRECARLMGFPEDFKIPVSDTQAYRQFGNSVIVPVMTEVARIMAPHIIALKESEETGVAQHPLLVS
jgi:DNA (cytosine-5)-methyltransferase 1